MNFNHFDLNLLKALDCLLTERNVTRAARQMSVTQQAMSGALHRLREFFEDDLLVRVGRQMDLSPLGRTLAVPVREAMLKVQFTLQNQSDFDLRDVARRVRVVLSDYSSLVLLPYLLGTLAREAPHICLDMERPTEQNMRGIDAGTVDFCLVASNRNLYSRYKPSANVRSSVLFKDDFVCVLDPANPLAQGPPLTMESYLLAKHVVTRFDSSMETMVENAWKVARCRPNLAATAPNFSTLIFMLPGTVLLATAQRRLASQLAPPLHLKILECPLPMEPFQIEMNWHLRSESDPVLRYMRDLFLRAASASDASRRAGHFLESPVPLRVG
jgi:DNA-binding transcriptional LysR family regulator